MLHFNMQVFLLATTTAFKHVSTKFRILSVHKRCISHWKNAELHTQYLLESKLKEKKKHFGQMVLSVFHMTWQKSVVVAATWQLASDTSQQSFMFWRELTDQFVTLCESAQLLVNSPQPPLGWFKNSKAVSSNWPFLFCFVVTMCNFYEQKHYWFIQGPKNNSKAVLQRFED